MDKKESARAYLKGYERGLREAWDEFMMLTGKGYRSKEIQILAKTKVMTIPRKLERRQSQLEEELGISLAEENVTSMKSTATIAPGGTYLVEETSADKSFDIYVGLLGETTMGLCIHRTEPGKILKRYGTTGRMIWLSKTEMPAAARKEIADAEFTVVSPTSLDKLTTQIIEFLGQEGEKVVMLGGLEFLLGYNEFSKVLWFLQSMKDRIAYAKAIMLVPYDPTILEEKDRKVLEREVEERL
jgi:hypothetical protein